MRAPGRLSGGMVLTGIIYDKLLVRNGKSFVGAGGSGWTHRGLRKKGRGAQLCLKPLKKDEGEPG